MATISNARLVAQVLRAVLSVAGRRTYDEFAVKVLSMVVTNLRRYFDLFQYVSISEKVYVEDTKRVSVDVAVDLVEPMVVAQAIERVLRDVCMELGDEALLYFISEIKEHIGESYVDALEQRGVDLARIERDHHLLYSKRKKSIPSPLKPPRPYREQKKPRLIVDESGTLDYTWNDVDTWEYQDGVCMLHQSDGSLLDSLQLDHVVENYINSNTKYKEPDVSTKLQINISEKEYEFLETLYNRDMDISMATGLLDVSDQKLNYMVEKLLRSQLLERISDTEVKLTQKGIVTLLESVEKK